MAGYVCVNTDDASDMYIKNSGEEYNILMI